MNQACPVLTARELDGYRQWLKELDEEAREEGGCLQSCDRELWPYFSPKAPCGKQVYESYTDEELLDILIRTMHRPGHSPRYEEVYCVYLVYIKLRFQGLQQAKALARRRLKRLELRRRWPPDWPARVSSAPVEAQLLRRGFQEDSPEIALVRSLCVSCRLEGLPPALTADTRQKIEELGCGDAAHVLQRMGIPALNQRAMKDLCRYWQSEREKRGKENNV